jgi:HEAT repeat protein
VTALAKIGTDPNEFVPSLSEVLQDTAKYPTIRVSAAHALAGLVPPAPETLQVLRAAQQDEFGLVRIAAARALWNLKKSPDEVLPTVAPLLGHKLKGVRLQTLKLISAMGDSAQAFRPDVERLLTDENEAVRREAAVALEKL